MVKSYRGKEVNMLALQKKNEHKIALGNAHQNARGDIIGRGGVIVKTREEQIKEYQDSVKQQEAQVGMKNEKELTDIERDLMKIVDKPVRLEPSKKAKKQDKVEKEEIIYDEE